MSSKDRVAALTHSPKAADNPRMNLSRLVTLAVLMLPLSPTPAHAQTPDAPAALRYKWTPGQTLRYTLQRDPYFADPARAIETADPRTPERPPIVERLTERVLSVGPDGTATLRVSVGPEPGFEDGSRPAAPVTLTVASDGRVTSPLPAGAGPDFLRAFFRLPEGPASPGASWQGVSSRGRQPAATEISLTSLSSGGRGRAVFAQTLPPAEVQSTSPDHDGTLLQTTRTDGADRIVFDVEGGSLVRQTSRLTVTVSLVMTKRGARGVADFGRVVPNVVSVQTMTIERRDDLPLVPAGRPIRAVSPSRALAGPRSKN